MSVRTLLMAAKGMKSPPKREAYPLDNMLEEQVTPWRANTTWPFPEFLGFGEYNGHRTVKYRFGQASTRQNGLVKFLAEQRITQIVYKRDKVQYTNANGYKSIEEIPGFNTSINANGLGSATANVWYTRNLTVARSGEFFGVSVNNTPSYPVTIEFYLIDDLEPF